MWNLKKEKKKANNAQKPFFFLIMYFNNNPIRHNKHDAYLLNSHFTYKQQL